MELDLRLVVERKLISISLSVPPPAPLGLEEPNDGTAPSHLGPTGDPLKQTEVLEFVPGTRWPLLP